MKKLLFAIWFLLALTLVDLNGQNNITYGYKAGFNLSFFQTGNINGIKCTADTGAGMGAFLHLEITPNFALQPELILHFKSCKVDGSKKGNEFEYTGLEAPLYIIAKYPYKDSSFFIGVGPRIGYGLAAQFIDTDYYLFRSSVMRRWDIGVGAIFGYEHYLGLQIFIEYKVGLKNGLNKPLIPYKAYPHTFTIGIGGRF